MMQISEDITARREAERALLGALLIEGTCLTEQPMREIAALVSPSMFMDNSFYDNKHSRIFSAMLACRHPHQIAVAQELSRAGTLRKGDCAYLLELIADCPCSIAFLEFAETVARYSTPRRPKYIGAI